MNDESRGWLDTFDQWVEPRDMSMYTPVIETPQRVPITEEIARQHPGVIILDPKRVSEFQMIDADVVPTSPGKVSLTLQAESSDLRHQGPNAGRENDPGNYLLVLDTGHICLPRDHNP